MPTLKMLSLVEGVTQHLRNVEKTCEIRDIMSKQTLLSGTLDPHLENLMPNLAKITKQDPELHTKV